MLSKTLRPDWRLPRDWSRPWRDPAGFFRGNPCDCKCSIKSSAAPCVTCGACGCLPRTLHLTFSNSGLCPCMDGLTFALGYASSIGVFTPTPDWTVATWNAFYLCPGAYKHWISVTCNNAISTGNPTIRVPWQIAGSDFTNPSGSPSNPAATTFCSPLNVSFNLTTFPGLTGVCNNNSVSLTGILTL